LASAFEHANIFKRQEIQLILNKYLHAAMSMAKGRDIFMEGNHDTIDSEHVLDRVEQHEGPGDGFVNCRKAQAGSIACDVSLTTILGCGAEVAGM
jgi:hypothetical protein